MVQSNKLANVDWFDGIRDAAKIGKFDQYKSLAQFINNSANLSLGEVRCRQVFQRRNDIKQFHRILQSRSM